MTKTEKLSKPKSGKALQGYLHGYTPTEQTRLYHQARFLEDHVFAQVDFSRQRHILEIGSGIGFLTERLAPLCRKLYAV